ncbi:MULTISPECIES: RICIN domain-containing protein [unclassified Actinotalea]|uniref:RICIN domain-containing protein n=1 Tax=unclassified Actinotalea TaxID=2638618 RepID=UPI0015F5EDDE|nr:MULTISPECIES: RICIN domain-containing protein [unclassified Actinotalea]
MNTPHPAMIALARRITRTVSGRDEGVAMVTTLLAIMLTTMLSILLLGVLLSQSIPTTYVRAASQTVFAAEAGVNAVVGQIRGAQAITDSYGDIKKLPCSASGPVDGAGDALRYTATVSYYVVDPTGRSESWLSTNAIPCNPGTGPVKAPGYARIVATGAGDGVAGMGGTTGDRTVSAVYEFQITNNNIPGGLIFSFDTNQSPDRYCLQADAAAANSHISYVPRASCGTDDITQLWVYSDTYQIKLASTTLPTFTGGPLCITATPSSGGPVKATLQKCKDKTDSARWSQLFSWEGGAKFTGQKDPISDGYSGYWLSSGQKGEPKDKDLHIWNQSPSNNEWGSFNPDPRVGAGAAGYGTHQIVNYLEFGRCFDVTDESVGKSFMIVYPCKQDPSGGSRLLWNHKWYYTEPTSTVGSLGPQQIHVLDGKNSGKKNCLVSPGTEGGYVTLTSSCSTTAKNQKWTRHADTGSYGTSWTFTDEWGRCASVGTAKMPSTSWSIIVTSTCNSGLGQKWNAPPNTISASLDGYQEIP